MKSNRFGEHGPIPFRTERIYSVGHEWFFSVRRGSERGPFASEEEAKAALVEFIREELAKETVPKDKSHLV